MRKKASDFPQELLNLFDLYVHGGMSRRAFLDGAQKFAVGGVSASALFEMLRPNYAWAIQVAPDDARIVAKQVDVPSPQGNGNIRGYLVRPAGTDKLPAVLVVHENRGLNPISRTWRGAWRSPISSPSRPTASLRSAAIRATTRRAPRCSSRSIPQKCRRISPPPPSG